VLRGGFGVDRAASPLETLSLTNIDVDKTTFLGGIGYRSGNTEINFVFVRAYGKERERTSSPQGMSFMESFNLDASIWGLGVTFGF
jgi:long-chain fatty acid transport protein